VLVTPKQENGTFTAPLRLINPSADTVKGGKVAQMDHMDPSAVVAEIFIQKNLVTVGILSPRLKRC